MARNDAHSPTNMDPARRPTKASFVNKEAA